MLEGVPVLDSTPTGLSHPAPTLRIRKQACDGTRKSIQIPVIHENTRDTVLYYFGGAATVGGHYGLAMAHCLEKDQAKSLAPAGHHEHVACIVVAREVLAPLGTHESHTIPDPRFDGQALEPSKIVAVADDYIVGIGYLGQDSR